MYRRLNACLRAGKEDRPMSGVIWYLLPCQYCDQISPKYIWFGASTAVPDVENNTDEIIMISKPVEHVAQKCLKILKLFNDWNATHCESLKLMFLCLWYAGFFQGKGSFPKLWKSFPIFFGHIRCRPVQCLKPANNVKPVVTRGSADELTGAGGTDYHNIWGNRHRPSTPPKHMCKRNI